MNDEQMQPASRTLQGVCDILFDEIDLIRAKKSTPARCRAVAQAAKGIVGAAAVGIAYQLRANSDGKLAQIELGTQQPKLIDDKS